MQSFNPDNKKPLLETITSQPGGGGAKLQHDYEEQLPSLNNHCDHSSLVVPLAVERS